jgi:hypothetical protein
MPLTGGSADGQMDMRGQVDEPCHRRHRGRLQQRLAGTSSANPLTRQISRAHGGKIRQWVKRDGPAAAGRSYVRDVAEGQVAPGKAD